MCPIKKEMSGESGSLCSADSYSPSTSSEQDIRSSSRWRGRSGRRGVPSSGRHGTRCTAACGAGAMPGGGCARCAFQGGAGAGSGSELSILPRSPRGRTTPPCSPWPAPGPPASTSPTAELLAVPASYRSLEEVRQSVNVAVEDFERRQALGEEDALSGTSSSTTSSSSLSDNESSSSPAEDSPFELEVLSDMGWDLYYASLAEGMLMAPPSLAAALGDYCEAHHADVPLWSYQS